MKNHLLFFSLIIAMSFLMINCTDENESDNNVFVDPENPSGSKDPEPPAIKTVSFADIVNAEVLYLTESKSDVSRSLGTEIGEESVNTLFKISFDGVTERVFFSDSEGQPIDGIKVTAFHRMSDKYIYMSFDHIIDYKTTIDIVFNEELGEDEAVYTYLPIYDHAQVIVQKSDGAVFIIDPTELGGYKSQDIISVDTEFRTDYNEHVYFRYINRIYKIYTHGKDVYITQINRDDMRPADNSGGNGDIDWLVDRRGNVLINKEYIRLVSGEFAKYEFPQARTHIDPGIFFSWRDSEGFYYLERRWGGAYSDYYVYYCRPESPLSLWQEQKVFVDNTSFNILNSYCFIYKDRTVFLQLSSHGNVSVKITIFDKDNIQLEELPGFAYPNIKFKYYEKNRYPSRENYLYGMSDSEIWRLKVETGEPEILYKYNNEFVIKSMTVNNGIITFTAFELRRGNDVIGEIHPDKTVNIIESFNGDEIIYLERI